jgi:hypothetical protein
MPVRRIVAYAFGVAIARQLFDVAASVAADGSEFLPIL